MSSQFNALRAERHEPFCFNSDNGIHLYTFFPKDYFSAATVLKLKNFVQKIERTVVILDMNNNHNAEYIDTCLNSFSSSKPLFLFLPRVEAPKTLFADGAKIAFPFGDDVYSVTRFSRQAKYYFDRTPHEYISEGRDISTHEIYYNDMAGESVRVAHLGKNYIYCTSSMFFKTNHGNGDKTNTRFVQILLDAYESWYTARKKQFSISKEERHLEEQTKAFTNFIKYSFDNKKNVIKREIQQAQQDMISQYKGINRLEIIIKEKNGVLTNLDTIQKEEVNKFYRPEQVKASLKSLIAPNMYRSFSFDGDNVIYAETQPISIESYGKKYYVGYFTIIIKLDGTITFENQDNYKLMSPDLRFDHPHVQNRVACFGNYKEAVAQQCARGEYLTLFMTLICFLKEYNDGRYGGRPFVDLEKVWGTEEDWDKEFGLPTRHPDLEKKKKQKERKAELLTRLTASQTLQLQRNQCQSCGRSHYDCYIMGTCNRCSTCYTSDCITHITPPVVEPVTAETQSPGQVIGAVAHNEEETNA